MNGYTPHEPISANDFTNWAQKIHREAFARRRTLITPDTLTYQTTQGVIHRPKPIEQDGETEETPPSDFFEFSVVYSLPNGCSRIPNHTQVLQTITTETESEYTWPVTDTERNYWRDLFADQEAVPLFLDTAIKLPEIVDGDWFLAVQLRQNQYGQSDDGPSSEFPDSEYRLGLQFGTFPVDILTGFEGQTFGPLVYFQARAGLVGVQTPSIDWGPTGSLFNPSTLLSERETEAAGSYIVLSVVGGGLTTAPGEEFRFPEAIRDYIPAGTTLTAHIMGFRAR